MLNNWGRGGGVYPIQPQKPTPDERLQLYLSESLLRRIDTAADKEIAKLSPISVASPSPSARSTDSRRSAARDGGLGSYNVTSNSTTKIDPLASVRGYKVVTFKENEDGQRVVFDILTGTVYQAGCKRKQSKISAWAVLFDSESGALSERFSPKSLPIEGITTPTTRLPRILCAFDGWGEVKRRHGGGGAAEYEYVKFVKVIKFIDPVCPHSKAKVEIKRPPNFFGLADTTDPPRNCSPRFLKTKDRPLMGK